MKNLRNYQCFKNFNLTKKEVTKMKERETIKNPQAFLKLLRK